MIKHYNVLIIPAGSGMAIAAIKMLKRDKKIRVISADADRLSPGLYLSHKGYVVPRFNDSGFFPSVMKIIEKEKINLIIPALDTILLDFSEKKKEFERIGVKVMVSSPETIMITRDKWKTYNALKGIVPVPRSFLRKKDIDIDFPLFIKPRHGSGSNFAYRVDSKEELDFFYKRIDKPIIQEYLGGKEYTVDCLADTEGKLIIAVPRERISTKAGISVKGKIVKNDQLEEMAKKISRRLNFSGPFFFQAKENDEGVPHLTEINARISGSMSFSSSAGPNLHVMAVKIFMGERITTKPKIKYGTYFTRYFEEICLSETSLNELIESA